MSDFTLQYHLTARCGYNCSHCYLKEPSYKKEIQNEHDFDTVKVVLDDLVDLTSKLSNLTNSLIEPVVHLTGGDPLLREDFFDILEYTQEKGIKVGILGNPDLVTTEVAEKLVKYNVLSYQVSLDGPEDVHNQLRGRDSFKRTLEAVQTLKTAGLRKTFVMYNVSPSNIQNILDTFRIVRNAGAYGFVFARVACIGNARGLDLEISPTQYRSVLKSLENEMNSTELTTRIVLKDPLWSLYKYETGKLQIDDSIKGGCQVGISLLSVLADGKVYACRRMESVIGKVPEESLYDIFVNSELLNEFRDFNNFEKCHSCPVLNSCRGCPAIAFGQTGSYFAPDPQCWH